MRETPADTFRYIRVPADAQGSMDDFVRLNGALHTPALRDLAVRRYASQGGAGTKAGARRSNRSVGIPRTGVVCGR